MRVQKLGGGAGGGGGGVGREGVAVPYRSPVLIARSAVTVGFVWTRNVSDHVGRREPQPFEAIFKPNLRQLYFLTIYEAHSTMWLQSSPLSKVLIYSTFYFR